MFGGRQLLYIQYNIKVPNRDRERELGKLSSYEGQIKLGKLLANAKPYVLRLRRIKSQTIGREPGSKCVSCKNHKANCTSCIPSRALSVGLHIVCIRVAQQRARGQFITDWKELLKNPLSK